MIDSQFIIGLEITKLSHKIVRALEAELITSVDKNMSATTARIVCYVVENGVNHNLYQKDIEHFMGLNRSSVSLILHRMEQNGLIHRHSLAEDARFKRIEASEKALADYQQITQAFDRVEAKMRRDIPNLSLLTQCLNTINQNLDT